MSWRALRRGALRWEAWVLHPDGPGTWFYVGRCLTRRGAKRRAETFALARLREANA